jgi:hypothetical protein
MSQLFAALDAQGEIRFVGDVPRGAACGCFCPACASPLVAKLGEVNEWHFAHVAGQERPDCIVGAVNLLRRLGVEYLNQLADLALPIYTEQIFEGPERRVSETVQWRAPAAGKLVWRKQELNEMPRAVLALDTGVQAQVYVDVEHSAHVEPVFEPGSAVLGFWIPMPPAIQLRTRDSAMSHIAAAGRWRWRFHPDFNGIAAAARGRLQQAAQREAAEAIERKRRAGLRWASIRRDAFGHEDPAKPVAPPPASSPQLAPETAQKAAHVLEWAKDRKDKSGFLLYRLRSGEAWVIYQLIDGNSALIPWPERSDGWEESLPSSFATYDPTLDALRITNLTAAMVFLGGHSRETRNTYDPLELLRM